MKKVLATGGTGYIGSHTAVELIENGYEVEIIDNLYNSKASVIDKIEEITGKRPVFHQIDLLDREKLDEVFKNGNFDAVIHFAGLKAAPESVGKPLEYYRNNITGTVNLLQAMQKYGVNEFVFSSSACVYGIQDSVEYVETMPTGQGIVNPYGRTKFMIEEIVKDYAAANKDLKAVLLRYFNPIGAHASGLIGEDPNGIPLNLMPIIIRIAQGQIPELKITGTDYDTADGTCRRDYIHVVDLAKGHVAALAHAKPGVDIYNLGSGKPTSVREMIAAYEKASGEKLPCVEAPRRPGDLPEFWANPSKALKELNWKTELSIDDAMRDTINYLKKYKEQNG